MVGAPARRRARRLPAARRPKPAVPGAVGWNRNEAPDRSRESASRPTWITRRADRHLDRLEADPCQGQ
jgi:hypothetical protein